MSIDSNNLKKFVDNKDCDQQLLYETLKELVFLVIYRHYGKYIEDTEIMDIGLFKAITMLMKDYVNSSMNITSFVYSGVRNEIGNHIKREKKLPIREISQYDTEGGEDSVIGEFTARQALEKKLDEIKDNFCKLGILISLDIGRILDGIGQEPTGYSKFALKAAFLWEFS